MKHDSKNAIKAQLIVIQKNNRLHWQEAKIVNENQLVKILTDPTDLLLKDFSI